MTTKRSYECNLCRGPLRIEFGSAMAVNGRGFTFGHKRLDWCVPHQAENHLCDSCIQQLIISLGDPGIVEDFGAITSGDRSSKT